MGLKTYLAPMKTQHGGIQILESVFICLFCIHHIIIYYVELCRSLNVDCGQCLSK